MHPLALELEVGDGTRRVDTAVIETDRGFVIVDTGVPGSIDALRAQLRDAGIRLGDVATVPVTHRDADHAGNPVALRERADPFPLAHETAARVVDSRELTLGADGTDHYPPTRVDLELGGEATITTGTGQPASCLRRGPARVTVRSTTGTRGSSTLPTH